VFTVPWGGTVEPRLGITAIMSWRGSLFYNTALWYFSDAWRHSRARTWRLLWVRGDDICKSRTTFLRTACMDLRLPSAAGSNWRRRVHHTLGGIDAAVVVAHVQVQKMVANRRLAHCNTHKPLRSHRSHVPATIYLHLHKNCLLLFFFLWPFGIHNRLWGRLSHRCLCF
jgi:hypothetical protein